MQSDEEILQQLEDSAIDDVLIVLDNGVTQEDIYNQIIYRKSDDTYYMNSSNRQINNDYDIQVIYVERPINLQTVFMNDDNILVVKEFHSSDNESTYNNWDWANADYIMVLRLLHQNNYTIPIIEQWKETLWSGLK